MTDADKSLNRPKGFPVGFRTVIVCWIVAAGLIPHAVLVALDVLQNAGGRLQDAYLAFAFATNLILLGGFFLVSGAGPGRIRAFWTLCTIFAGIAGTLSVLDVVTVVRGSPTPASRDMAIFLGVICTVLVVTLAVLFARLSRLRWMDRSAQPGEWEPVMVGNSALARSFDRDR